MNKWSVGIFHIPSPNLTIYDRFLIANKINYLNEITPFRNNEKLKLIELSFDINSLFRITCKKVTAVHNHLFETNDLMFILQTHDELFVTSSFNIKNNFIKQ